MIEPDLAPNQTPAAAPQPTPTPRVATVPRRHPHAHRAAGALESLQSLLYVLAISLFVVTFTVQPIRIPSESMEPTLLVGDFLLMDKQVVAGTAHGLLPPAEIHRGDIVVFHEPVDDPAIHLVKRVIAIPGDRIHLRDGLVYRNGELLHEPYAVYRHTAADTYRDNFPTLDRMDARVNPNWWIRLRALTHDGEITVPSGNYFVMGDNRNDSEDSRYWGFVPRSYIVGRPLLIYFSARPPEAATPPPGPFTPGPPPGRLAFGRWDRMFHIVH